MKLWWLVVWVGCDHPSHHGPDAAPPVDADPNFCDVSAESGHAAVVTGATSRTFSRVYAGGIFGGGGVIALDGPPITPMLLFTDDDHLSQETLDCCAYAGSSCCTLEGAIARADTSAIGAQPVQLSSFQDSAFVVEGTITITDYVAPFQDVQSRIAGSITTTTTGDSVNAMFDTTFCPLLVTTPI